MTAVSVIRQSAAVHLITDGACILPDGKLKALVTKVQTIPHAQVAVAFRSAEGVHNSLAGFLDTLAFSYDEMKAKAALALKSHVAGHADLFTHYFGPTVTVMDVFFAGWSEVKGPDSFMVTSYDRPGLPTWAAIGLDPITIAPGTPDTLRQLFPAGTFLDDINLERDGARILEAQRQLPNDPLGPAFVSRASVGGFGQLTTITADAITTKIIHRWPADVIGQKLGE